MVATAMASVAMTSACSHHSVVGPQSLPPVVQPSPEPSAAPTGAPEATALENLGLISAMERTRRNSSRLVSVSASGVSPLSGRIGPDEVWTYGFADDEHNLFFWGLTSAGRVQYYGLGVDAQHLDMSELRDTLAVDSDRALAVAMDSGASRYVNRYPAADVTATCRFLGGLPTWSLVFRSDADTGCRVSFFVNAVDGTLLHSDTRCFSGS
jgi:hypothetical protein